MINNNCISMADLLHLKVFMACMYTPMIKMKFLTQMSNFAWNTKIFLYMVLSFYMDNGS